MIFTVLPSTAGIGICGARGSRASLASARQLSSETYGQVAHFNVETEAQAPAQRTVWRRLSLLRAQLEFQAVADSRSLRE